MTTHLSTGLRASLFLLIPLLAACTAEPEVPAIDRVAEARALLEADRAFAALSEESDPRQAFAAFLAPNGMLVPRRGDPIEGHAAAVASFGEAPGFELLWQPQFAEVSERADMGWTWGRWQLRVDGQQVQHGKYVNVWQRQANGEWKVRVDVGNVEPPADPPAEPAGPQSDPEAAAAPGTEPTPQG